MSSLIAGRVRAARTERGWTLDELAARSGVSRRMLVHVEQATANVTIATLLRITDALGIGLPSLVDVEQVPHCQITARGAAPVLWRGANGGEGRLVAGTAPPDVVELWDWRMEPGDSHDTEAHSPGTRELVLVLAGALHLRVGQDTYVLDAGDSARFAGDEPHCYSSPESATVPTLFALTVFEPGVGRSSP